MFNPADAFGPIIDAVLSATPPVKGSSDAGFAQVARDAGQPAKLEPARQSPDLKLPWKDHTVSLFELTEKDIRFCVGVQLENEERIRAAIPIMAKEIRASNTLIANKRRISTCFIFAVTAQFAFWNGEPVIAMDEHTTLDDPRRTAHEMAHAIFHDLCTLADSKGSGATRAFALRLLIADTFARLSKTETTDLNGKKVAAGHAMLDPSQWRPGTPPEHPGQDVDEFFASAFEAYQFGRSGLEQSIAQWTTFDASIAPPAADLMKLLLKVVEQAAVTTTSLTPARRAEADEALGKVGPTNSVERGQAWGLADGSRALRLLIEPSERDEEI